MLTARANRKLGATAEYKRLSTAAEKFNLAKQCRYYGDHTNVLCAYSVFEQYIPGSADVHTMIYERIICMVCAIQEWEIIIHMVT